MTAVSYTYGRVIPFLVTDSPEMQVSLLGDGGRVRGEGVTPAEGWDSPGETSALSTSQMFGQPTSKVPPVS